MMLRTQIALAMTGAVMLTAIGLGVIAYPWLNGTTVLNGSIAVGGMLIASFALARILMQPLTAMSETVQAFARNGLAAAPMSSGGEFAVLARAFHGMAADVRRKSEALYQESSKRRYIEAALIETSTHPVITLTADGVITAWNPAAERLYGYTASEATGKDIAIIIPADRREEHHAVLNRALSEEPVEAFESVRLTKDGRQIDVALSIRLIGSPSGEIVGLLKITRDITAQKLTEEKFRLAVESSPSGMIMIDRLGYIVLVNGEVERLFGYSRNELLGQKIEFLLPEGLRAQHNLHRDHYTHQPETRRMGAGRDLFGRRKDGTEVPVEVGLNPIHTREGPLILSVIVDISERKRMERLKDDFVSTVSHELRTPLTSIAASLGILAGATHIELPDAARRLITIANSNSARLVRLINDILDVEKIESGQIAYDLRSIELRPLIEQTIEANKALAEACGVTLRFEDSAAYEVYADLDRLTQVVTNLLSNAIKFSPSGADVTIALEDHSERVRTIVRDHGPGIPEAFKPRIFEKFAQADASNARQKGGTGLGLNIVKQIVQRLGGDVGFADAPGGGTEFYFDLRRAAPELEADAVVLQQHNGTIAHKKREPS